MKRVLALAAALCLVAGFAFAQGIGWKTPRQITRWNISTWGPAIGTYNSQVVTIHNVGSTSPHFWFKGSSNYGVTFSDTFPFLNSNYGQGAQDDDHWQDVKQDAYGIHAVTSSTIGGVESAFYVRSTDGGVTWTSLVNLAQGVCSNAWHVNLSLDPNGINVVFGGLNPGTYRNEVYYSRFNYPSGPWTTPVAVTSQADTSVIHRPIDGSQNPSIATKFLPPNGYANYIAYEVYENGSYYGVCYKMSVNSGSWTMDKIDLPPEGSLLHAQYPSISVGTFPVVAWQSDYDYTPNRNRIFSKVIGGGKYLVGGDPPGLEWSQQQYPRVVVDPTDSIHVVWQDSRYSNHISYGGYKILYNVRSGNELWNPANAGAISTNDPTQISAVEPDIASSSTGGYRHVVWIQPSPGNVWYCKKAGTQVPSKPKNLQAGYFGNCPLWGHPYLWWDPSPSQDVAGYNVYRRPLCIPPCQFTKIASIVPATSYIDASLGCCASDEYYVTAVNYSENESDSSNHAFISCGIGLGLMASVDAGTPNPSPYTQRRAGYYAWGSTPDSTVDYDPDSLVYQFSGLDPDTTYTLGIGFFQQPNNAQRRLSVSVNGVQVRASTLIPTSPVTGYFKVPKQVYRSGTLRLAFKREQGPDVVLAKLSLYLGSVSGGPQSAGEVEFTDANTFLSLPHPNPSSRDVEFEYRLPGPGEASLVVCNVLGQKVRTLVEGPHFGGSYRQTWDRRDDSGVPVPAGIYFVQLKVGRVLGMRRVVLVR